MILKVSFIVLCCVLLAKGQGYDRRPSGKCQRVRCRPSRCISGIMTRLQRTCCSPCPPKPPGPPRKCRGIHCNIPICGPGVKPITQKGNCCPSCPVDKCALVFCPILTCPRHLQYRKNPTDCCKRCPGGCYAKNGKHYQPGDNVPNSDPCKWCTCSENSNIECAVSRCERPNCLHPIKKLVQCCETCPPHPYVCRKNGIDYKVGEPMSDPDPCKHCTCTQKGELCAISDCARPICQNPQYVPGQCCPVCPVGCYSGGIRYDIGQIVPTTKNCQTCQCEPGGNVVCNDLPCPELTCLNPTKQPGKCCSTCPPPGCYSRGIRYDIGQIVPTTKNCQTCQCEPGGNVVCNDLPCPELTCLNPTKQLGKCCSTCPPPGCYSGGIRYDIGQIVPTTKYCQTCQCELGGNVICNELPCPELTCPNPTKQLGKCCSTCPPPGCYSGGIRYDIGQIVPTTKYCQTCQCEPGGNVVCNDLPCPELTCPNPTKQPGKCCSTCPPPGCYSGGIRYDIGAVMPNVHKPCKTCICGKGGVERCTHVKCRRVRCRRPIQGACCPTCPPTGGY